MMPQGHITQYKQDHAAPCSEKDRGKLHMQGAQYVLYVYMYSFSTSLVVVFISRERE